MTLVDKAIHLYYKLTIWGIVSLPYLQPQLIFFCFQANIAKQF